MSLVGVVIGAALGAALAVGTSLYFEWRSENREFNEATRVVDDELATNAFQWWSLYKEDEIPASISLSQEASFPTDAWTEYRGIMARLASQKAWEELASAYLALRVTGQFFRNLEVGTPLTPSYKARIYEVCHRVQMARGSLRGPGFAKVGCEADR